MSDHNKIDKDTAEALKQVAVMSCTVERIDKDLTDIKECVEELNNTVKAFKKYGYFIGAAFLGNGGMITWFAQQNS